MGGLNIKTIGHFRGLGFTFPKTVFILDGRATTNLREVEAYMLANGIDNMNSLIPKEEVVNGNTNNVDTDDGIFYLDSMYVDQQAVTSQIFENADTDGDGTFNNLEIQNAIQNATIVNENGETVLDNGNTIENTQNTGNTIKKI